MLFSVIGAANAIIPRMLRVLLLPLLLLVLAHNAFPQCTRKLTDLPPAPELLGFHLGMSKDDIKQHVPQTVFGKTDHFGVAKTTINPFFDPKIDKTKFQGVRSISLDLVDDRLTSLWIGYDETFKAHTTEEFVNLISQSLKVDGRWSSWKSKGQQLHCADFELIVSTVAGGPSLRVLDVAAEDLIAQRRQAKEEQDAAAEAAIATSEVVEEIIADKQSKTYYPIGCRPEREISMTNKLIFKSPAEAERAGFKAAKNCH